MPSRDKLIEHINKRERGEIPKDKPYSIARDKSGPGRPTGSKSRMLDLTQKLLSTNGKRVVEKIIQIALEDGNPNQLQALKMCVDRIAPVGFFEDLSKSGGGQSINIQVNVVNPELPAPPVTIDVPTIEVRDVEDR